MESTETILKLGREEAIVLMELLSRFANEEDLSIKARAEEIVLWRLQGQLEKTLVEPFSPKWNEILDLARHKVEENN